MDMDVNMDSEQNRLNTLIIGAGRMGAMYDTPESDWILSHAHAVTAHSGFDLAGFVDPHPEQGKAAASRWGGEHYVDLEEAILTEAEKSRRIDGVVVTTPDHTHGDILKDILNHSNHKPSFVVAEKPFTGDPELAQAIATAYEQAGILLVVNFTRRFVSEYQALQQAIRKEEYGKLLAGNAYYGKGWRHNGSHLMNTLQWLFDDVKTVGTFGKPVMDYGDDDPSFHVHIQLSHDVVMTAHAVDSRIVTVYEMELLFEKRRIRVLSNGQILSHPLKENPVFAGYVNYDSPEVTPANLGQALPNLYTHVLDCLGEKSQSSISSPLSTINTLQELSNISAFV